MNISAAFIARPIATWLLAIAIVLAGGLGYLSLPISALPQVDFPTIQVTTQLPGSSPQTTATLITASLASQPVRSRCSRDDAPAGGAAERVFAARGDGAAHAHSE